MRRHSLTLFVVFGSLPVLACGEDGEGDVRAAMDAGADANQLGTDAEFASAPLALGTGEWTVYPNPYGDGGANPANEIVGTATAARAGDAGMRVTLTVSGLQPNRKFGAHVHKLACTDMMAGGHYQNEPAPADAGAVTSVYATAQNEVWLDCGSDALGAAEARADQTWVPRPGQANSLVVHDHSTEPGGAAGPKLACLKFSF